MRVFLVSVALLLAGAVPAAGQTVYDSGTPPPGAVMTNGTLLFADDFTLSSAAAVSSVTLRGSYNSGSISYQFYSSGATPQTLLASGTGQNLTAVAGSFDGLAAELINFDLVTPFNAAAGTQYWLAVQFSDSGGVLAAPADATAPAVYSLDGGSSWSTRPYDLSFTLQTVPEPEGWAMMIGGFALAGGAVRRRRMRALALAS